LHGRRNPRQRKEATSFGKPGHNDENGGVPLGEGKISDKVHRGSLRNRQGKELSIREVYGCL
jgi:hypothetical protein